MSLLIGQTRSKLDGVIRTIDDLRSLDYPFPDPVAVLNLIREAFAKIRADFGDGVEKVDETTIKNLCKRAQEEIQNYLPILGFIERSSDLEAPVEMHGPVARLTRKAIQTDANLVIFPEWDYSPFTFLFPELTKRGVVVVGMPRSESHNALLAPLSGHELGHNVWQRERLTEKFSSKAQELIVDQITKDWSKWKDDLGLSAPEQLSDLVGYRYIEAPHLWSIRQAEETFCDFIGLLIFRDSYLHSFRYLLTPGESVRLTFNYPTLKTRARFHAGAAKTLGIPVPSGYEGSFDESVDDADGLRKQYGELADLTCQKLVDDLLASAQQVVSVRNLSAFRPEEVARVRKCLKMGVPTTGTTGIENILIGAWQFFLEDNVEFDANLAAVKAGEGVLVLNELILKTLEVNEIEERLRAS